MPYQRRSDDGPLQLAIATTQGRHCDRCDAPLAIVGSKVVQPGNYVVQLANRAPVLLRWKVDDQMVSRLVYVRFANPDLAAVTSADVILEHVRVPPLEGQGYALAHDADAVHRIDQSMSLRCQQVAGLQLYAERAIRSRHGNSPSLQSRARPSGKAIRHLGHRRNNAAGTRVAQRLEQEPPRIFGASSRP